MPALVLLVLATLFWAGNYVVGERVVDTVGPLSLTWWRWALAAVPLLVLAQVVERPDWRRLLARWPMVLLVGLLGVAAYPLLLYAALLYTSATSASIINAVNPAFIVIAAVLLGQASASKRTWAGVAIGLVGVLLVLTNGDVGRLLALQFNTGNLIMLCAVVAWTAYTLLGRRLGLPVLSATALQVVLATLVLTPFTVVSGIDVPPDPASWWAVAFIVVFPSVGSYLCWNLAISRVSPAIAGVSMNLVTVFTVVIAAILGQPPTAAQLAGGVLVIAGVVVVQGRLRRSGRVRPGPDRPTPTRPGDVSRPDR